MPLTDIQPDRILTASDLAAARAGCKWNQGAVDRVLRFASTLRNPMDPSQPYKPLRWQVERVIEPLFGWRRPDGRRRFTRLIVYIPKKNGKTSLVALLSLYMLLADGEPRPHCVAVSTTARNAGDIYDEGSHLLGLTAGGGNATAWCRYIDPLAYRMSLIVPSLGGIMRSMTSSADNAQGVKGSLVIIDEAHATLARTPALYESLRYAGSGRRQPLQTIISTAGDDRQSLPYQVYADAKRLLASPDDDSAVIDTETLVVIYEAKDQETYTPAELAAANPAVGEVLSLEQLVADYESARLRPYEWQAFRRYRLNIWTSRNTAWLQAEKWDALADPRHVAAMEGRPAYIGVDLSSVGDLTAACVCLPQYPSRYAGEVVPVCYRYHYWLPSGSLEDRGPRELDYLAMADAGHMTLIDGPQIDYGYIAEWIRSLPYEIVAIGFDPWHAKACADYLEDQDFPMYQVRQGWNLSETALRLESDIEAGSLVHDGNAVTSWCMGNAEVRRGPTGQIMVVKGSNLRRRIDGTVATLIARHLQMFHKTDEFVCG